MDTLNNIYQVDRVQYMALQGFVFALRCFYQEGIKTDLSYWADMLDSHNIPWSVQNRLAMSCEKKVNNDYYLSTILKRDCNAQLKRVN